MSSGPPPNITSLPSTLSGTFPQRHLAHTPTSPARPLLGFPKEERWQSYFQGRRGVASAGATCVPWAFAWHTGCSLVLSFALESLWNNAKGPADNFFHL
ncbi:unnamed protein product [Protopolystoma xenopodis]|uniref:Uncharacterized protein n=1 Tax=Protopolystoma xenopodis TaxID=117903 RepID=A0A3S5A654_9PLAT|nr:unnamed protein product [Protopolystoma xenopodis]